MDLETGRIVLILGDLPRKLEWVSEEDYDAATGTWTISLEECLEDRDDPEWQMQALLDAGRVERYDGTGHIRVESDDPYADHDDME